MHSRSRNIAPVLVEDDPRRTSVGLWLERQLRIDDSVEEVALAVREDFEARLSSRFDEQPIAFLSDGENELTARGWPDRA